MPLRLLPTFFDGAPPVLSNAPQSPVAPSPTRNPMPVLVPKVGWLSRFVAYQGHHGYPFDLKARSAEQANHFLLCASPWDDPSRTTTQPPFAPKEPTSINQVGL